MRSLLAVLLLVVGLATACGDDTDPGSPTPTIATSGIPRLDRDDSGATVMLDSGATASITLVGPDYADAEPEVDGDAVSISEDISDAPDVRTWTVTALAKGTATVHVGQWTARFVVG